MKSLVRKCVCDYLLTSPENMKSPRHPNPKSGQKINDWSTDLFPVKQFLKIEGEMQTYLLNRNRSIGRFQYKKNASMKSLRTQRKDMNKKQWRIHKYVNIRLNVI